MVTGDSILTAISVSKECGLVQSNQRLIRVVATVDDNDEPSISYHLLSNKIASLAELKEPKLGERSNYVFALDGPSFSLLFFSPKFPHAL